MDDTDDVLDMDLIREKINTVRASPVAKAARTACECSELQLTRPPIVLPAIAGDYQESGRPGLRPTHARAVDQQNHRGLSAGASCNCPPAPRANCPSPATMIAWRYLCRSVQHACPHTLIQNPCNHPQRLAATNDELVAANPEDAKVFKFVVHCMLQQRTGAAIQSATCQYWDKATDRAPSHPPSHDSMSCSLAPPHPLVSPLSCGGFGFSPLVTLPRCAGHLSIVWESEQMQCIVTVYCVLT